MCLDKQYDGSYIFGITIIYTDINIFIVWFYLPNVFWNLWCICSIYIKFIAVDRVIRHCRATSYLNFK